MSIFDLISRPYTPDTLAKSLGISLEQVTQFSRNFCADQIDRACEVLSEIGVIRLLSLIPVNQATIPIVKYQQWADQTILDVIHKKHNKTSNVERLEIAKLAQKHKGESGVYLVTGSTDGTNMMYQLLSTTALNEPAILLFFSVARHLEFLEFLKKHPDIKAKELNDGFYNFEQCDIVKLNYIGNKQKKWYDAENNIPDTKTTAPKRVSNGHKIQKYSLNGQLLATYVGIRDATQKENISDTSLITAIKERRLYRGFRWLFLNRNFDDNTVQELGPTVHVNSVTSGSIAKIDIEGEIKDVYPDQRTATTKNGLKSPATIHAALRTNALCNGHYFKYFVKCDNAVTAAWLAAGNLLPDPIKRTTSKVVKQVDHITGDLVKEWASIIDVQKALNISRKCLKNAIVTGEVVRGFKWTDA